MLEQKEPYYNLIAHMMGYENLHAERIQHFLKVYEFAKLIGTEIGRASCRERVLSHV